VGDLRLPPRLKLALQRLEVRLIVLENLEAVQRLITNLQRDAYISFGCRRQQWEIPMLVLGRGGKNNAAHFDHATTQVKVSQITALQKFRVHVLVAVMELHIVAGAEAVGCPEVQAAAFAADGIADNLPIIGVAAQIMGIRISYPHAAEAGYIGINALCAQIDFRKPRDARRIKSRTER
jgi:hypothetical protein